MKRVVLATRNQGKVAELRQLLAGVGVEVVPGEVPEVAETGETFVDNAILKARAVALANGGAPALADDSGLEVDALGGAPGVRSARYAGEGASDEANNARLLAALAGVPAERRTARFRAAVVYLDGEHVLVGEGACEGVILEAPRGAGGFGYDPLFYCPELGATFAEAGTLGKGAVSHRARALAALMGKLADYLPVANGRHHD